jgi:clan AA aspartic protease
VGQTHVTVEIKPLTRSKKAFESLFLVDTGALHCFVPAKALKKLGVPVEGKFDCERADGRIEVFDYGFVRAKFMGQETVCHAIFAPDDAEPLLGVVPLENTGFAVDPRTRALKRLHAVPLKGFGGRPR